MSAARVVLSPVLRAKSVCADNLINIPERAIAVYFNLPPALHHSLALGRGARNAGMFAHRVRPRVQKTRAQTATRGRCE